MTYVKRIGIEKKGNINTEIGKFRIDNVNAKATSPTNIKIIIIAKTLLASVKIVPPIKNSCNLDKYF